MKSFNQLLSEVSSKSVVFTFGRLNPPSVGHAKLIQKVIDTAKSNHAVSMIFLSRTEDNKKNPLSFASKLRYLRKCFKDVKFIDDQNVKSPFHAMKYLSDHGYKTVTLVAGSDRVKEYDERIRPYINHQDKSKSFEVDHFSVVSAGERDPDAEGDSGASGTKMREFAKNDDFDSFLKNSPSCASEKDVKMVFKEIQQKIKK